MIEKKIHYCWFGGNPLNETALKCIESWKRYFPDYEIIQWNETNFEIDKFVFAKQAYSDRKWAFVSDVARLAIIYEYGGLYFDTDVEVIKDYSDIINDSTKLFIGLEQELTASTGLGFGAVKGHPFVKENLDVYLNLDYEKCKEDLSSVACPLLTTKLLKNKGFVSQNSRQTIDGIDIYPYEFFSPMDYSTGELKIVEDTHSIHWYTASWHDEKTKNEQERLRKYRKIFGSSLGERIYGIRFCIKKEGFFRYCISRIARH